MKKTIKSAAPVQVGAVKNRDLFLTLVRQRLRSFSEQMLLDEVSALCGASHYPQPGATYRRAGTEAERVTEVTSRVRHFRARRAAARR